MFDDNNIAFSVHQYNYFLFKLYIHAVQKHIDCPWVLLCCAIGYKGLHYVNLSQSIFDASLDLVQVCYRWSSRGVMK